MNLSTRYFNYSVLGLSLTTFYLYYNPSFNCDLDTAQKYDLNYLRRWIENKSDPSLWDYPVIIKYNPKMQLNPPRLFSN